MDYSENYIVVGCKSWNKRIFDEVICHYPGKWTYIDNRDKLDLYHIDSLSPRYIFFLHWSWKVPKEITDKYECVGFHATDLPYGRGGSPIQNLILRGEKETVLTSFRMTDEIDAGLVYYQDDEFRLDGNVEQILSEATAGATNQIYMIITFNPTPQPQYSTFYKKTPVYFTRRTPEQSKINEIDIFDLEEMYDFIRMLDGEGYPRAFLTHSGFRFEFSHACVYDNRIEARVVITKEK